MDLDRYADAARETAQYAPRGTELGLAHATLGLAGETTEYLGAGWGNPLALDELGDVCWYLIAVIDEIDATLSEIRLQAWLYPSRAVLQETVQDDLLDHVGHVCELVKKATGKGEYGQGTYRGQHLPRERHLQIVKALASVLACVTKLAELHESTLAEVFEANVAKLAGRAAAGTVLGGDRSAEVDA